MAQASEREHPRYAHEAAITVHAGGMPVHGRTMNVSRGGLCADVTSMIPLGTEVQVDMQLVFEDDVQSDPLRVAARVVWCTTLDDAYQVGLAFKPLVGEKAKYLALFLRYLDDNKPAPKPVKGERSVDDQFR